MTSRRGVTRAMLAMALVALAGARTSAAQARTMTGNIVASVDIVYPPLTAAGVRPLDFGMIIPGTTSVIVTPNTIKGGEFRITGTKSRKSIDITFTLPTALTGPAGATMPMTFNGNYAGLCEVDDATGLCITASYATWNPVTTPSFHDTPTRYSPGRKTYTYNTYSVYIGGQVTPAASAVAGRYSGTVNCTIVIN